MTSIEDDLNRSVTQSAYVFYCLCGFLCGELSLLKTVIALPSSTCSTKAIPPTTLLQGHFLCIMGFALPKLTAVGLKK